MTYVKDISYKQVGDLYGLQNWVEYGFKQCKNELGWADFRVTDYAVIEKWWEVIMSAYLMVALHTFATETGGTVPPELDAQKLFRHLFNTATGIQEKDGKPGLTTYGWFCCLGLAPIY